MSPVTAVQTFPGPSVANVMLATLLFTVAGIWLLVLRIRSWSGRDRPLSWAGCALLALVGLALMGQLQLSWTVVFFVGMLAVGVVASVRTHRRRRPQRPAAPVEPSPTHEWTPWVPPAPQQTVATPATPPTSGGWQSEWAAPPAPPVATVAPTAATPAWAPAAPPAAQVRDANPSPLRVMGGLVLVAGYIAIRVWIWNDFGFFGHSHPSLETPKTIALDYSSAIVAFEHDFHRPPLLDTTDWPVPLTGPVSASGQPYLAVTPPDATRYVFWQTGSRSGQFVSAEGSRVPVITPPGDHVVQYVPYGRTWNPATSSYGYEGYLVLVRPDAGHEVEASGDPPTVRVP
jgi:hypothetical protein